MFSTLYKVNVPSFLIKAIVNWYGKLKVCIKWNGVFSGVFNVYSGVRQGGVLSPFLFNLYVNCIITELRRKRLGCCINDIYLGILMYADDILLLSSSCIELQNMLNVCSDIGTDLSIHFNAKKSACCVVGPHNSIILCTLSINNINLMWHGRIKYLGFYLKSATTFTTDFNEARRNYFTTLNNILSNTKHCSEMVKLELIERQCMPILLYCMECFSLSSTEIASLNSWINMAYRKIFGYNKWESVRTLLFFSFLVE